MSDDTNENVILITATEASILLKIQNSTLRKYCQLLEKSSYHFHKNEQGHRGFFDKDIVVIKRVIEASRQRDMSLEKAVKLVVSTLDTSDISTADTQLTTQKSYLTEEKFEEYQMKQDSFHRELLDRMNKQNKYINDTMKKRDEQLMESMRLSQESRRIEQKKKEWWKFWKE